MALKVKIGDQYYTSTKSKTPYTDIATAYAKQANQQLGGQLKQMKKQLASSKAGVASNYDNNAAQAYVNYARQQNELPEQLRAQGVNGGASESAMVRMANNYALNQANNNAARSAAMADLQSAYDTNTANLRQATADAILQNNLNMAAQQAQYTDTLQQRAVERYSATMDRFHSVDTIDKTIKKWKKLQKTNPNAKTYIMLLQQRRAQLIAEQEEKAAQRRAASGYGGYGGSGRGYSGGYSGGGGGDAGTAPVANPVQNVQAAQSKGQSMTDYYRRMMAANAGNSRGSASSWTGANSRWRSGR